MRPATDPVLSAIREARSARDGADEGLRVLLAYAREVVGPRPYTLAELAAAAGLSISGVRGAYGADDVLTARALTATPAAPAGDRDSASTGVAVP